MTRLADTVVLLSDGKAIAVGDVDEVMTRLDLRPQTGRYEAGAVIDTVVAAHDSAYELTTLHFNGGDLLVPRVEGLVGRRVRVPLLARDVSRPLAPPAARTHVYIIEGDVPPF